MRLKYFTIYGVDDKLAIKQGQKPSYVHHTKSVKLPDEVTDYNGWMTISNFNVWKCTERGFEFIKKEMEEFNEYYDEDIDYNIPSRPSEMYMTSGRTMKQMRESHLRKIQEKYPEKEILVE